MEFDTSILREADIRGVYPTQVSGEFANRLGKVYGTYVLKQGFKYIVVGHDNRIGGPHLTKELIQGLLSTGINVIYIGLATTPMLNYASHKLGIQYGIEVTASHNPKNDNGFKLFGENYLHCSHEVLAIIYAALSNEKYRISKGDGTLEHIDVLSSYAKYVANKFKDIKPLRVVVDCGNGTGSTTIRQIYERIPGEVIYINSTNDPRFPNHHPDPNVKSNLVQLSEAVLANKADLGLAYDGDADRVGFVDEKGEVVDSDVMMALMSREILKNSNKPILVDVKCSRVLLDEIKKLGGDYILETPSSARQEDLLFYQKLDFAGGYSNHIFFGDSHPGYDDGIYAGLRFQEMLGNSKKELSKLVKSLPEYYNTEEIKISTTDEKKWKIVEEVKKYCEVRKYEFSTVDGVRVEKEKGWALVRASNTGPNLTLRFEATSKKGLTMIQKEFMDVLNVVISKK